jgi:hypothetical protein
LPPTFARPGAADKQFRRAHRDLQRIHLHFWKRTGKIPQERCGGGVVA